MKKKIPMNTIQSSVNRLIKKIYIYILSNY